MSTTEQEQDRLTCKDFVEIVTEYLEGTMSAPDRERFEAHLAVCPGCQIYLEQIRGTIRLSGALREEEISSEARRELLQAFRGWKHDA